MLCSAASVMLLCDLLFLLHTLGTLLWSLQLVPRAFEQLLDLRVLLHALSGRHCVLKSLIMSWLSHDHGAVQGRCGLP